MLRNIIAGMVLALTTGAVASAATLTYSFQGVVNGAFMADPAHPGNFLQWYAPISACSCDFTISLPAVDSDPDPNSGQYESSPVISGDLTIGTDNIPLDGSSNSVDIVNDVSGFDHVIVNFDGLRLFLQDSSATALNSDAIPTALSISQFDTTNFSYSTKDLSHFVNAQILAVEVSEDNSPAAAPLPAAVWGGAALMGCMVLGSIRKRIGNI